MIHSKSNRTTNLNGTRNNAKRKHSTDSINKEAPSKKRLKTGNGNVLSQPKNTVAMLNELRQGLVYKLDGQDGPVHAPMFTMSVEVDGQKYYGKGRSKKCARIQAASTALRSFIQFKDGAVLSPIKQANNVDFTSDDHLENGIYNQKIDDNHSVELFKPLQPKTIKDALSNDAKRQVPEKGPVMLLYELFNDVRIECLSTDGYTHSRFKMAAIVNGQSFEGTGPSKKLAKNAAAKAALAALCDISYSPMNTNRRTESVPENSSIQESYELQQTMADAIGKLVLDKFVEITTGNESFRRRKVLAGIVMIENSDISKAKVIAVSTGTKCVNGEHMSVHGAVLNDSHAEIVSRRCLMDFLYGQLEMHSNPMTAKYSIFNKPSSPSKLYTIKDNIRFHLYINTAPCGDARIFSPHENDADMKDKHPNRKARGQLRTKIESGEGTIPVSSSDGIQTWDGVIQGQRLLTMSCSDKIARWNVLGVQGALLASLIEPIYLHSIVLGSLLHPSHLYRAVCGRVESTIQGLPPPYYLNKPKFALVTSTEARNSVKAPNFSVNWTCSGNEMEVINSLTGKPNESGRISRITKQTFFQRYINLIKVLPDCEIRKVDGDYGETKQLSKSYQIAKQELFAAFKRSEMGNWLKKPLEQDQFYLTE